MSEEYLDIIEEPFIYADLQKRFEDFCVQPLSENINLLYVKQEEAESVFPSAEMYSVLPRCYSPMKPFTESFFPPAQGFLINPLSESGVIAVQDAPLNLVGRGVLFACISSGIDYTNPLFLQEDGTTRIEAIWDQSLLDGTPPPSFLYGSEFTRDQINTALRQENPKDYVNTTDFLGVGTKLSGIATGSGLWGDIMYTSPAPEASLLIVKLKEAKKYIKDLYCIEEDMPAYAESDIMAAMDYVSRFVRVSLRPVVVLLGVGTAVGNHAGTGPLDSYLKKLLDKRNFSVVVPIGNEGNQRHHVVGEFGNQNKEPRSVEISVGAQTNAFFMSLWAVKPAVYDIIVRSPAGESTGRITDKNGKNITFDFVYGQSRLQINYVLAEDLSGWQAVFFRFLNPIDGIWTVQIIPTDTSVNTKFHMWLPMKEFLKTEVFFIESDPYVTLTSPSISGGLITVSGYQTDSKGLYLDSSRGYTALNEIVPDFSAPAEQISTLYGRESGTQYGAAISAGAVCQLMQWAVTDKNAPYIDAFVVQNYLIRGAIRSLEGNYPNREFGYGRLNIEDVFRKLSGLI